ncbi:MAG: thiosulfate oxidation carrier protein SoxY [Pseudomonadota bacterium]
MDTTRREALAVGIGAVAALTLAPVVPALASANAVDDAIAKFAGGKKPTAGKVAVSAPEIAENGNTVPIAIEVESPMTEQDHVTDVLILADGNPNPDVATFHFTPMSGMAAASTRIRLAKTQNVIAVAKMSDGSVFMDKKTIKVTIGGCGG